MTDKATLRAAALAARAAGGDSEALTARLAAALAPHAGRVLAGYWPMRGEADPRPAMAGHDGPLCLPVVAARAAPLLFRSWAPGETLEPGPLGTSHPAAGAAIVQPEVLIVPLAGFDRAGHRLGYGGGYYDRTLAALRRDGRVTGIGLAFAAQELPRLPAEPTDQSLDLIVTEAGIIRCDRA